MKKTVLAMSIALAFNLSAAQNDHMHDPVGNSASYKIMMSMHEPMVNTPFVSSNSVEVDFLSNMIPHHQGAVDSSKLLLEFSKNDTVRKIAKTIISDQEKEIKEFNDILKNKTYSTTKIDSAKYDEFVTAERLDMKNMMADMGKVEDTNNVDRDFLQSMIFHHQGAIDASNQVLKYTKDKTVIQIAKNIIKAQEKEIKEFNELLKNGI
ncbi:DUF305 domain-containing protein [Campylobacter fetus]|uniref:DUF305 domain-containing protein n=1 Tax=Campylobacter fetus subsp. testudinum TaxID=1507806 RepID=A0AAX0HC75_CAMFE|nr:DUF305 domain-containing protein [Campylobacter fetus]ALV64832.1 hypothetical protein (DUF305 domain) [Campylobacter fetus subsp. testudinum Sp3]OCR85996.1 hypothetical protein CFT12S05168_01385 [Campylobacter fetus subsp. testudinum]OCR91055.1 hypothetical protein CFT12S02225_03485 [Campylobacter fetus subsp. testudinum]OCR93491.1 hypothetical protein CFT12S02263_00480 [Campylobacter fetus subsp. testudinum]OCR95190.1 hypothetical protein CFT12S02842_00985 [Campylobacter fetus subsp. testu